MSVQVDVNALFVELVAKEMIGCGETKQVIGYDNQWTIACTEYEGANRERYKAGLASFLQQVWRATEIVFYTKHGAKPGQFWVRFTSVDF
jgi:hypothetical protein